MLFATMLKLQFAWTVLNKFLLKMNASFFNKTHLYLSVFERREENHGQMIKKYVIISIS